MKTRHVLTFALLLAAIAAPAFGGDREDILKTRETVWRAWFANDTRTLTDMVPADAIVISSGEQEWKNQQKVFQEAVEFQQGGGKLIRLEFPHTEMQLFGDVAVIYTTYIVETEESGKHHVSNGRATEIFARRNGHWVNTGWHTDHGN